MDIYVEFLYNVFVIKDPASAKKLYKTYKLEFTKVIAHFWLVTCEHILIEGLCF